MSAILADAGLPGTFTLVPAKRMTEGLATGDYDAAIANKTLAGEEKGFVVAAKSEMAKVVLQAFAIGTVPAVTKKEDLIGQSVILNRGYQYAGWRAFFENPDNKVNISVDAADALTALRALKAGRAPTLLQYKANIDDALQSEPTPDLMRTTISSIPIHIVVSRKRSDADTLINRLENALIKLRSDRNLLPLDAKPAS